MDKIFKVGDRVRIIKYPNSTQIGAVGVINGINQMFFMVSTDEYAAVLADASELEHVETPQQEEAVKKDEEPCDATFVIPLSNNPSLTFEITPSGLAVTVSRSSKKPLTGTEANVMIKSKDGHHVCWKMST